MNLFTKLMIWIGSLFLVFLMLALTTGWMLSEPGYQGPETNTFDGTRFHNLEEVPARNFFDVLKWYTNRDQGEWEEIPEDSAAVKKPVAQVTEGLVITYVNHSTFLIQTAGLNILTDPVWSYRVSPFSFAGPRRYRAPGIRFEDLPEIDLIILSHNHYDHLDIETLKKLNQQFEPKLIVPLGVGKMLEQYGIHNTVELDWWESEADKEGLEIHSVPAQHFSARGMFDRDKTLWAGYVLNTSLGSIYFAGDTGYGSFFEEIGTRHPNIKVGLIPIGAYKPRWFMKPMHVDPSEAIQVHKDVGAEISFGMHFGTFPLADDGQMEPANDFDEAMQQPENRGVNFKLLNEGDQFEMSGD